MAASTDPILGLSYGWAIGDNFKTGMDANLRKLAALVQTSVADRDLATPPGSPANGDRYIVAASGTGAWSGHDGKIAVYETSAWVFYTPAEGWKAWVKDEDLTVVHNGTSWVIENGGAWTAPTLLNSWANISGQQAAQHRKAGNRVDVRFSLDSGTANGLFNLPAGSRPPATFQIPLAVDDGTTPHEGHLKVQTDGDVIIEHPGTISGHRVRAVFSFYVD